MKTVQIMQPFQKLYSKYVEALSPDHRKKIAAYLYMTLTLLTVSFFGLFAISPTLSTISNLNKQYADNMLILDALNNKLTSLTLLDAQYREIQPDIERVYLAVPRTPKMPHLTRQIENIAKDSGVAISKFNFGTVELYPNIKNDPVYSFTFNINVSGDEQGINNFITTIIGFDRIVGIDKISTGINEENEYGASIIGRAYFSNK
jgi:Tfp pilus assembly protein PilO